MKLNLNCIHKNIETRSHGSPLSDTYAVFGTCDEEYTHCQGVMCPEYEERNGL